MSTFTPGEIEILAGTLLAACAISVHIGRRLERNAQRRRQKADYRAELNGLREPRNYVFTR